MTNRRRSSVWCGLIGLIIGSGVIATSFNRWAEDHILDEPLHYLAAIPPFAVPLMEDLPDPVVIQLFLVWWAALGGVVGYLAGRGGRKGALSVAVALTLLAGGHVATKLVIEERVDFAKHEDEEYSYLIRWLVE